MKNFEIETTYTVLYQEAGDVGTDREGYWYIFTNVKYEHTPNPQTRHDETLDLAEAQQAATELYDRKRFIDSRPKYQRRVSATRVLQRISGGGTLLTFGQPVEEPDKDAAAVSES